MPGLLVKVHLSNEKKMIAICDKDLFGKKIVEGKKQLDLTGGFYNGVEKEEKEILELLHNECHLNIIGEKAIAFCIKNKLIGGKNIIKIGGVPHAEIALAF